MSEARKLGIIGGSGVYAADDLIGAREVAVDSSFGEPSAPFVCGTIAGVETVFLARHGAGHRLAPSTVNYRANIDAMKRLGVTDVISISSVGSLRENMAPGGFVAVDQFIDRTRGRASSFFGDGFVAHVSMAEPVCPALRKALLSACADADVACADGGVYLAMEGPQFSTRAESELYRQWGADVIGMTNMPEAKLAREAELPYATLAMVTDYDCWREASGAVEVAAILDVIKGNTQRAQRVVKALAGLLGPVRERSPLGVETCLDMAAITAPGVRDPALLKKLEAVAGRFLARS